MLLGRLPGPSPAAAAARCSRLAASSSSSSACRAALPQLYDSARRRWQHGVARAASNDADAGEAAAAAGEQQASTSASSPASRAKEVAENLPKAFVSEDEWRQMDEKVNKYPCQRTFTAIGTGGADFKAAMTAAVEAVVGTVHVECVSERPSSGGKYVSVRVGPVWVENPEQVIQVFTNMRQDQRLKWYM